MKAISWSPIKRGLLLSGGGNKDKTIKEMNILNGDRVRTARAKSQITGMIHTPNQQNFVTFHGFSMNNLVVWDAEKLKPIRNYKGHTKRVIYYAMGPCGSKVVTGGGDETVRFWKLFDDAESNTDTGDEVKKSGGDGWGLGFGGCSKFEKQGKKKFVMPKIR